MRQKKTVRGSALVAGGIGVVVAGNAVAYMAFGGGGGTSADPSAAVGVPGPTISPSQAPSAGDTTTGASTPPPVDIAVPAEPVMPVPLGDSEPRDLSEAGGKWVLVELQVDGKHIDLPRADTVVFGVTATSSKEFSIGTGDLCNALGFEFRQVGSQYTILSWDMTAIGCEPARAIVESGLVNVANQGLFDVRHTQTTLTLTSASRANTTMSFQRLSTIQLPQQSPSSPAE